jgi:phosphinothricin acetyltransferase
VIVRAAAAADAPALAAIYGHHVREGLGTFEEESPSAAEMAARLAAVQGRGLDWLVAELDGEVAGYAYATPFRLRAAYRYTVEDSVYVAPGLARRGLGRILLAELIARCETLGLRQMVAVIGDSANHGSIGLHAALGFEKLAVVPAVGFKHGRWVDIVWMQRALGPGAAEPPTAPGLDLRGA